MRAPALARLDLTPAPFRSQFKCPGGRTACSLRWAAACRPSRGSRRSSGLQGPDCLQPPLEPQHVARVSPRLWLQYLAKKDLAKPKTLSNAARARARYFCGPHAKQTAGQAKQQKKRPRGDEKQAAAAAAAAAASGSESAASPGSEGGSSDEGAGKAAKVGKADELGIGAAVRGVLRAMGAGLGGPRGRGAKRKGNAGGGKARPRSPVCASRPQAGVSAAGAR